MTVLVVFYAFHFIIKIHQYFIKVAHVVPNSEKKREKRSMRIQKQQR